MKLINSINETRYKKINTIFISDYKWEFLANKYHVITEEDTWKELEEDYKNNEGVTDILYGDVNGYSCFDILQSAYNYKGIERLLKNNAITLYTNKDKEFYILTDNMI